jgi:hypothetical protein
MRSFLSAAPITMSALVDVPAGDIGILGRLVDHCGISFLGLSDQPIARSLIALGVLSGAVSAMSRTFSWSPRCSAMKALHVRRPMLVSTRAHSTWSRNGAPSGGG